MSQTHPGYDTELRKWDGAAYMPIGQVEEITPPALTSEMDEVTVFGGTGWKDFAPTLNEIGEMSFTIIYHQDQRWQTNLRDDLRFRRKGSYELRFNVTGEPIYHYFDAFVQEFKPIVAKDASLRAEVTLRPIREGLHST